ncbi:uncharacterized protein LOC116307470 [Actinia tenebrosa]|uniref:Uncharacterized protein LOC116307470 n=1 Tax=Actinia tenebrosa TaxID=6105 RepID=A0A6P8J6U0_ACTTE|nr:uncharacterized protein LOC116307470 [Actinia tenebrosa]
MNSEREPDTYVIQRVSFGDKPAGTIATAALRKTAEMAATEYPQAAKTIIKNTYMDDIINSAGNKEETKSLTTDIEKEEGGFQVKYWTLSREFNQDYDTQTLPNERDSSTEKVLGVVWGLIKDQFYFRVRLNSSPKKKKLRSEPDLSVEQSPENVPEPLTKRMILSQVNGIYDQLGLAEKFKSEWLQIFRHLFDMENISFNRYIKPSNAVGEPSLVIFSDGSQEAYGACAYVRWEMPENTFESELLMSKNRLTPVKKMSIDRIELRGAVLNKRLKAFIEKESRYHFVEFYHPVDSQIVQAMIQKESYGFNVFAGTRIGEIQEKTEPSDWYWMDGELNIADWLTLGKKPDELDIGSVWQKGPEFLKLPTLMQKTTQLQEALKVLSSEDIEKAEQFWIRDAQKQLKQNMSDEFKTHMPYN